MEKTIIDIFNKYLNLTIFTLNQTTVTIGSLLTFIFLLTIVVVFANVTAYLLRKKLLPKLNFDVGTVYNLERLSKYFIILVGSLICFQFVGIDLSGLAVIFGLFSVGIGFGLQNITSNFVAGLILLFERPIKVGDRVTIGETLGNIIHINMRATTINSVDNVSIIVPNSDFISGQVINWSYGDKKIRLNIDVGTSYDSDLDLVLRCLKEVADENPEIMKKPEPVIHFVALGDSSWNFKLRCWIPDPNKYWHSISSLNCDIVRKFKEHSIEIPFPQRDLHIRSSVPIESPYSHGDNADNH